MRRICLIAALFLTLFAAGVSAQTELAPAQITALKDIKANAEKQSAPYAMKLATTARQIYENMLSEREDQRLRRRLSKRLHYNAGKLLDIRGRSYREALAVLTPAQRQLVRDELKKPDAPTDLGEAIAKTFGLSGK